jgi:hypothetical protein
LNAVVTMKLQCCDLVVNGFPSIEVIFHRLSTRDHRHLAVRARDKGLEPRAPRIEWAEPELRPSVNWRSRG